MYIDPLPQLAGEGFLQDGSSLYWPKPALAVVPYLGPAHTGSFDSPVDFAHNSKLTQATVNALWAYDDGGYDIYYNGANQSHIMPHHSALDITGDLTIFMWYGTATAAQDCIYGGYDAAGGNEGLSIFFNLITVGKIQFWSDGTAAWKESNSNTYNDGNWNTLAVVGDQAASTVTFYLNGLADGSQAYTPPTSHVHNRSIGAVNDGTFPGEFRLRVFYLFSNALSAKQIGMLHNNPLLPVMPTHYTAGLNIPVAMHHYQQQKMVG